MRVYQKLAVASAGLSLSFTTVKAIPAQAARLKYDFTVNIPEIPSLVQPLAGSTGSVFLHTMTLLRLFSIHLDLVLLESLILNSIF